MKEAPGACGLVIGAGKSKARRVRVGLWSLAEALGTAGWLLRSEERGRRQNCLRNVSRGWRLLAGGGVWVLRHLGAFQMIKSAHIPLLKLGLLEGPPQRS